MNWDEENIKKKFEGYEVTPSSQVWDNIDKQLNQKGWAKWPIRALSALLLISSLGVGYYYWQGSAKSGQDQLTTSDQTTKEQVLITEDEANNKSNAKDKSKVSGQQSEKSSNPSDEKSLVSENDNVATDQVLADKELKEAEKGENRKKNKPNKSNTTRQTAYEEGNRSTINEEIHSGQKSNAQEAATKKTQDESLTSNEQAVDRNLLSSLPLLTNTKVGAVFPNPEKAHQFKISNSIDSQLREEGIIGSNSKWAIGVEAGPFQQGYQYRLEDNSEDERLSRIKNSESEEWGYGININGYWKFADNWQLQFGIGYERLRQEFSHSFTRSYQRNIPNSDGVEFVTETIKFEHVNQFQSLRMPLAVRYQILDSRLKFFVSPGVEVNALANANAMLIGLEEKEVYNTVKNDMGPMKTYTLDYTLDISAQYALDDEFSVLVRPFGQLGSGSIYSEKFSVDKQSYQLGINAGLIYGF